LLNFSLKLPEQWTRRGGHVAK